MIFKLKTAHAPQPGWLYIDNVAKVRDYGSLCVPSYDPCSWRTPEKLAEIGDSADEDIAYFQGGKDDLQRVVAGMWGPADDRSFADELWPDLGLELPTTVKCVVFDRRDGSCVLALIASSAFLMSDEGHTIDRLR